MQSFQNLQVVKRQQVDEFARRLIFLISQAVVAILQYKLFQVSQDSIPMLTSDWLKVRLVTLEIVYM